MNMPLVLLNRRRRGGPAAFSPTRLFALAEPGVWYDPSDLTTLFTDTAGTTPVTTPGQTVALALDKSKGLVLGSEQIVNGSFSADTDWTKINGATISGGVATLFNAATTPAVRQLRNFTLGRTYLVSLTWTGTISAGMGAYGSGDIRFLTNSTLGSWTGYVTLSAGTGSDFWVQAPVNSTATVDNISVRELPGFHATQATAASRPTYGIVPSTGRRNLLTRTEEFGTSPWANTTAGTGVAPTVTADAGNDPNGQLTADRIQFSLGGGTASGDISRRTQGFTTPTASHVFSVYLRSTDGTSTYNMHIVGPDGLTTNIVVTGAWQRFSVAATGSGSTVNYAVGLRGGQTPANSNTADVLAWGAQLETGSSATAYQRVGSAFDVTEAGVASLSYLFFGGEGPPNDARWLVTPTITPGTDKAQVFAGVRKLSDAAIGIVAEMSVSSSANQSTIALFAPSANTTANYGFRSHGTIDQIISATTFTAPISNVVTGLGDISGDRATLRVNGSQVAQSTGDQGTGNYSAQPLYIGRRGGTTLGFNGFLFGLIVRFGTNLDAGTITSTETWVAGKTGVTL